MNDNKQNDPWSAAGWLTADDIITGAVNGQYEDGTVFMLQMRNGEVYLNGLLKCLPAPEGWCLLLGGYPINPDNLLAARRVMDIKL